MKPYYIIIAGIIAGIVIVGLIFFIAQKIKPVINSLNELKNINEKYNRIEELIKQITNGKLTDNELDNVSNELKNLGLTDDLISNLKKIGIINRGLGISIIPSIPIIKCLLVTIPILTPPNKTYNDIYIPIENKKKIIFDVKISNDAYIGLFTKNKNIKEMYEILLGGGAGPFETINSIRDNSLEQMDRNMVTVDKPHILNGRERKSFWIDINNGSIRVGEGTNIGSNIFMEWTDTNNKFDPVYISFSAGLTSEYYNDNGMYKQGGSWNICF